MVAFTIPVRAARPRVAAFIVMLAAACESTPRVPAEDDAVSSGQTSANAQPESQSNANVSPPLQDASRRLRKPRVPMAVALRPIRRIGVPGADAPVENPVDLRFSSSGLLVSDHASLDVRIYNSASGAVVSRFGRYGRGPWEFVVPPTIIGTYDAPLLLEASVGRIHELSRRGANGTTAMNRSRQWTTGCQLPNGNILTQASSAPVGMAFYESELGGTARLVDSIPHPIARVSALGFIVRQTALRQVDDSTCGYFPVYHPEWAITAALGEVHHSVAIESLPPATMVTEPTERGARYFVNAEARAGHVDARAWRDYIVVLFQGTTRERNRLLDFYSRSTLTYVGSVVLPRESTRIAIHSDTLAVIETVDDVPQIQMYLMTDINSTSGAVLRSP